MTFIRLCRAHKIIISYVSSLQTSAIGLLLKKEREMLKAVLLQTMLALIQSKYSVTEIWKTELLLGKKPILKKAVTYLECKPRESLWGGERSIECKILKFSVTPSVFRLTFFCAPGPPRDDPAEFPPASLEVQAVQRASGITLYAKKEGGRERSRDDQLEHQIRKERAAKKK